MTNVYSASLELAVEAAALNGFNNAKCLQLWDESTSVAYNHIFLLCDERNREVFIGVMQYAVWR